jgi:GNAT superfamily N-acetyltransferase
MITFEPLTQMDYAAVKRLFQVAFGQEEDKHLPIVWQSRSAHASLGVWMGGALVGAAIVRDRCLEYIFVDSICRGSGIGTQLLHRVIAEVPAVYLTPVNDQRIIRWYESQGFCLSSQKGEQRIYVRRPYALRSQKCVRLFAE